MSIPELKRSEGTQTAWCSGHRATWIAMGFLLLLHCEFLEEDSLIRHGADIIIRQGTVIIKYCYGECNSTNVSEQLTVISKYCANKRWSNIIPLACPWRHN